MKLNELTINEYSMLLEAKKSVPGGGSCLALVLELACDLGLMSVNFTIDKKGYENVQNEIVLLGSKLKEIKTRANELIELDGEAYQQVMDAFRSKDDQKIKDASLYACEVPYELYKLSFGVEELCERLFVIANKNVISDAKIGSDLAKAVRPGCISNIKCNINQVAEEKREKFLLLLK